MFYIHSAPESSYARALLGLLLDRQFWPGYQLPTEIDLPEVKGASNNEMLVFPNPSNGLVRLELPAFNSETTVLQAVDLTGRSIQTIELFPRKVFNVDFTSLPKGIYILQACSKEQVIGSTKIIID